MSVNTHRLTPALNGRQRGLSRDTWEFLWAPIVVAFVLAIILLITGAARSGGGPGDTDHRNSLPAGVAELNASTYLLHRTTTVAGDICWGSNQSNVSVYTDRWISSLQATFVQCAVNQNWNVHAGPGWSVGDGISHTITDPVYYLGAGTALLISFMGFVIKAISDLRENRQNRRTYTATAEDVRRELRVAFARGEIEEPEMEHGLNIVYNIKGIKREVDVEADPFRN